MEFIVRADFDDFEAFLDEERRELPKLFKAPVAVEDVADILCGVVSGDTKIVCHSVIFFRIDFREICATLSLPKRQNLEN